MMLDQILSAIFFPGLLVIVLARVTLNRYVALFLVVALIAASAKLGYTDTWWLIIIDAFSITIGFVFATNMLQRIRNQEKAHK